MGVFHAVIIFLMVVGGFLCQVVNENGMTEDWGQLGAVMYVATVLTVLAFVALNTQLVNAVIILVNFGCIVLMILYLVLISYVPDMSPFFHGVIETMFSNPAGVFNMLLTPLACYLVSYFIYFIFYLSKPSDIDMIRSGLIAWSDLASAATLRLKQYREHLCVVTNQANSFVTKDDQDSYEMNQWTLRFSSL
jgi:hypothetical protein